MAKNSKEVQARADAKRRGRTRNFATVVYPDSAPPDWLDKLQAFHVKAFVSPLHDKDVNPDGQPKKAHYHVLLMFDSPQNYETQVKPIFAELGAVGRENVISARGYARYLCHLDNPEKTQYSASEVVSMGGANYYEFINLPTDDIKLLGDIFDFVEKNGIYSFAELLAISRNEHPEWFALIVTSKAYIVDKFIKSLCWESESGYARGEGRK